MDLSKSRKKKLDMLLRSISHGDFTEAQEILRTGGRYTGAALRGKASPPLSLIEACPGAERTARTSPRPTRYWLVRGRLDEVAPERLPTASRYVAVLRGVGQRFDELEASAALCHAVNLGPEDLLFLDIETCGFLPMPIFLIGVMFSAEGCMIFEQYLARDYSEERAILHAFAERLDTAGVLVTFNGKAFDMNLIRERSAYHTVDLSDEPPHLDLLHESRRRWAGQVPNCKLQTLERYLLARHRPGDISGADIPDTYHNFVRTADARRLRDILHHNIMDLLTMADLLCAILTGCEPVGE